MAKQTFITGQVLTAAQQNTLQTNDFNQTVSAKVASYVLVAADAGTRITMSNAAATTITVNTGLFAAGDTLQITNIGAGVCTITAGTATVSTAGLLTLAQNATGILYFTSTGVSIFDGQATGASAAGLDFISATAFTSVTTVSVNNCFSATYNNYLITINETAGTGTSLFFVKLRVASVDSSASYVFNMLTTNATTVSSATTSPGTAGFETGADDLNRPMQASFELMNPFATTYTVYRSSNFSSNAGGIGVKHANGYHALATSYDGMTINWTSSATGTVRVYGLRNS